MAEYRKAKPEEREAIIDLANYVFSHANASTDFEALLPKVYGRDVESSQMHWVAADDAGRLRAIVAVLPQTLTVSGLPLRAGYVGTVSVHPRARSEGHMKALMGAALDEMRQACDLSVLSGLRQRYEYFGYTKGGVHVGYSVNKTNVRHALRDVDEHGLSFHPLFEVDGAEAFAQRLNASRPAYIVRDGQALGATFATFTQKALGVVESGTLVGYLVTNEAGDDISELAMEKPLDIIRTVKAYMVWSGKERISVSAPIYDRELNACLGSFAENYAIEPSGMVNILDFANVLRAYLTLQHRTFGLTPGTFSAVLDGQSVTARVDAAGVTVERTAQPGAAVLDKRQAQTLLLTHHGRYMDVPAPEGWFPLPVFWYTADKF